MDRTSWRSRDLSFAHLVAQALAAAAEQPGLIPRLFVTPRASSRGKYAIQLYDWLARKWVVLAVDDHLPCTRGGKANEPTALFAQPHGREIWVALLEKAFAKLCGSYGALDGGQTAWALNALTGDPVFVLRKAAKERVEVGMGASNEPDGGDGGAGGAGGAGGDGGDGGAGGQPSKSIASPPTDGDGEVTDEAASSVSSTPRGPSASPTPESSPERGSSTAACWSWERLDMRPVADESSKRAVELIGHRPAEMHDSKRAFLLVRRYVGQRALLGASFGSYGGGGGEGLNGEDLGPQGLICGHAYTVLDAKRLRVSGGGGPDGELCLVKLRNPWGRGEWEGAWSDGAAEWTAYPMVKKRLRPTVADDGCFWMRWDDFERIFEQLDVCARTSGVADLQLRLHEADGHLANCAGPLKGCVTGCVAYWCCARGCAALYGAHGGQEETIDIGDDEEDAYDDTVASRVGQMLDASAKTVQNI